MDKEIRKAITEIIYMRESVEEFASELAGMTDAQITAEMERLAAVKEDAAIKRAAYQDELTLRALRRVILGDEPQ